MPASATSLPDGVYTVTLAYQNAAGDPLASDTAGNVVVDTVTQTPILRSRPREAPSRRSFP